METRFAPPERDSVEEVRLSFSDLNTQLPYDRVLDLIPESAFIVNAKRQLLFANAAARSSLGLKLSEIIGLRPGEILGCVHAAEMPGGCGTAESCRVCGVVRTLLDAIEGGSKSERECRVTIEKGGRLVSLDVRVTAVPISSEQGPFLLVTFVDISDKKRRELLERLFFHDLINSLSSLQAGMFLISKDLGPAIEGNDFFKRVSSVADVLVDEVVQQKELFALEKGDLLVEFDEVDLPRLARTLFRQVELTPFAKGRVLVLRDELPRDGLVGTDPVLLRRVILNMLKNALEASLEGEEVSLALGQAEGCVLVSVHNPGFIAREHQLQIFQRSFSTKGGGRGIGTYSMRLLTEEYLGGHVSFSSDEVEGTTFTVSLPLGASIA